MPKYMTITDIAALLSMSEGHVRDRLTRRRDFPAGFRLGTNLRWAEDEVLDWIESRRVNRAYRPRTRPAPRSTASGTSSPDAQPSLPTPAASAAQQVA